MSTWLFPEVMKVKVQLQMNVKSDMHNRKVYQMKTFKGIAYILLIWW